MTDASPQGTGSRRLKYALIASLALNLLIIGGLVGSGFKRHGHHPPREHFGLMGLMRVLPAEQREEVLKQLKEEHTRLRPLVEEIRAARHEAADRLAAEPFDRAALETTLATVADKERSLRGATVAVFLAQAEKLTDEQRRQLAERWRKRADWTARHRSKE